MFYLNNPKVLICDCDHKDVDSEKKVFGQAGVDFRWLHCKNEQEVIDSCQGAVVFLNQYAPMNEKVFKGVPSLKLIVRYGVGVDNVDVPAATRCGVQVCNVPDYGTYEVADHALALMLALVRKICMINSYTKEVDWDYKKTVPVHRNAARTVGVVGVGRIGRAFADRVHALGCRVIGYDSEYGNKDRSFPDYMEFMPLEQLLEQSDVVSLHCALTAESKDIIGEKELRRMKPESYLINVARGGLIDEQALDKALGEHWIAGAGLDVVKNESLGRENPLFRHPNLIITPHMAWYSEESAEELNRKCAEEAVRFLRGETLHYPVNHLDQ